MAARSSSVGSGVISTFMSRSLKSIAVRVDGKLVGRRLLIPLVALCSCSPATAAAAMQAARLLGRPVDPGRHLGRPDGSPERRVLPPRGAADGADAQDLVYDIKARAAAVPEGGDAANEPGVEPGPPPVTVPTATDPTATVPTTTRPATTTATPPPPRRRRPYPRRFRPRSRSRTRTGRGRFWSRRPARRRARPERGGRDRRAVRRAAGLAVPSRFGTEVVARLIWLRLNHPAGEDNLELRPQDPATRAEAAYSVAQASNSAVADSGVECARRRVLRSPTLPSGRSASSTAVHFIGCPYIWGGVIDNPRSHSASRRAEASTARASSGASTSSRRIRTEARFIGYPGPHDVPDERRGAEVEADPFDSLRPPMSSSSATRAPLEPVRGRPHGNLPRKRLDHPLVQPGGGVRPLAGWYRTDSPGPAGRFARPGSS